MAMAMAQNQPMSTPKKRGRMPAIRRKAAQAAFLAAFEKSANVTQACRAADIDRSTFYDWMEKYETFSLLYHQAEQTANDNIRAEIFRRGHDGWDEAVYQLGKYRGTVRKYSDTLLIFLAKARMPEFREKQSLEVTTPGSVEVYKVRIPDNGRDG